MPWKAQDQNGSIHQNQGHDRTDHAPFIKSDPPDSTGHKWNNGRILEYQKDVEGYKPEHRQHEYSSKNAYVDKKMCIFFLPRSELPVLFILWDRITGNKNEPIAFPYF
jgi:hypothetical protein